MQIESAPHQSFLDRVVMVVSFLASMAMAVFAWRKKLWPVGDRDKDKDPYISNFKLLGALRKMSDEKFWDLKDMRESLERMEQKVSELAEDSAASRAETNARLKSLESFHDRHEERTDTIIDDVSTIRANVAEIQGRLRGMK